MVNHNEGLLHCSFVLLPFGDILFRLPEDIIAVLFIFFFPKHYIRAKRFSQGSQRQNIDPFSCQSTFSVAA